MKILSIITEKGGVGKTTTSIHLGASFSEMGYKVLQIDFDAQRNLSMGYRIDRDYPYTIKNFLDKTGDFRLTQKKDNLFILAGDRNIEKDKYSRYELKERIDFLNSKMNLDFVIIDCPPRPLTGGVGLGEMALSCSDYVISPIEAEMYSIEGINELFPSIQRIIKEHNNKLKFLGFFFNKVLTNTRNFREYTEKANSQARNYFLTSFIRQDVNVENAKKEGKTIFQVAPHSRASLDFNELATEILKEINI
ncbi:AAA family ATPase [Elizabethkingia argentiflava]|uniref:AAA family ATPase n=1 Tax=Elizabethkingia argenteiflava TaxID=2681556 RepID=A0A845PU21_9FLAO|nr:ParA family protein [Elizabethkingia argenteiflava]NAW49977.1 AAA family ATPase [Elizabethkingia argenteiflava]